jgi:hypothetical protein
VDWQEGTPWRTADLNLEGDRPPNLARQYNWDLQRLNPPPQEGQILTFWMEAEDANDITGPGKSATEKYQVRIVTGAEKRDELSRRLTEAVQGLETLKAEQENASRRLQEIVSTELRDSRTAPVPAPPAVPPATP